MGKKLTKKEVINRFNIKHDNFYDYSLVEYINNHTKVKIICPEHDIFEQIPKDHLKGHGCRKCYNESVSLRNTYSTKEYIEKASIKHNNFFDYSKTKYINSLTPIIITCPIHDDFTQRPDMHLLGHGCEKCRINKNTNSQKYYINKVIEIHNGFYDYTKTVYLKSKSPVVITCPIHGDFTIKQASMHYYGGCPECNQSKGEKEILKILERKNIKYTTQKKFKDCKNINHLKFDFYLSEYNICIEFDGKQHYEIVKFFGGENGLKLVKKRDKIKNEYCINNNIELIRIRYDEKIGHKLSHFLNNKKIM